MPASKDQLKRRAYDMQVHQWASRHLRDHGFYARGVCKSMHDNPRCACEGITRIEELEDHVLLVHARFVWRKAKCGSATEEREVRMTMAPFESDGVWTRPDGPTKRRRRGGRTMLLRALRRHRTAASRAVVRQLEAGPGNAVYTVERVEQPLDSDHTVWVQWEYRPPCDGTRIDRFLLEDEGTEASVPAMALS